jgi:hypothetical protein
MRRGSVVPGLYKKSNTLDQSKRRQSSLKDIPSGKTTQDLLPIKDGDIYYKTERIFPSIPDHIDDIIWTVTKPIDSSSPVPHGRKSATGDRRYQGVLRDGAATPQSEEYQKEGR